MQQLGETGELLDSSTISSLETEYHPNRTAPPREITDIRIQALLAGIIFPLS